MRGLTQTVPLQDLMFQEEEPSAVLRLMCLVSLTQVSAEPPELRRFPTPAVALLPSSAVELDRTACNRLRHVVCVSRQELSSCIFAYFTSCTIAACRMGCRRNSLTGYAWSSCAPMATPTSSRSARCRMQVSEPSSMEGACLICFARACCLPEPAKGDQRSQQHQGSSCSPACCLSFSTDTSAAPH